jgi:hypothetical protein
VPYRGHRRSPVAILEEFQRLRSQCGGKFGVDLTWLGPRFDREAAVAQNVEHAVVLRPDDGLEDLDARG